VAIAFLQTANNQEYLKTYHYPDEGMDRTVFYATAVLQLHDLESVWIYILIINLKINIAFLSNLLH
jgi:hypothetical protein